MKYFKNTSWLIGEKVLKMGISFFVIILLTRYLGPENYGLLSYSQSFIGLFVSFSTLGLEVVLVRELANNKDKTSVILGTAITLKLIASMIAFLLVFIINVSIKDREAVSLTNIIAFTLIFQSINLGMDTYFQANVLSKLTSISNTIVYIISTLIKLYFIFSEADLVYFAYILVFDSVMIFIGYILIYRSQKKSILSFKYDHDIAIKLFKSGWPTMMVSMAVVFYTKIDQVMIKYFLNNESVGYYSAAIKVSELFYFIPLLVTQSIFPEIIEKRNSGKQKNYYSLLLSVYKVVLWTSVPIVVVVIMLNEVIIDILFGSSFAESSQILSVLIFCLIFISIGSVSTKILYAEHYEKKYLKRSIFGMLVNIGLNFILIPIYGAIGAAISTLITLFMIHYVYDLFDKDLWKFYHLKIKCFIPIKIQNKGSK